MIVGVLLAAGSARRFGGDKLLAELGNGQRVAEAACASLRPTVDRLIAVIRPAAGELAACLSAAGAELCEFPGAEEGMGASLAYGVRMAPDADGWLIALADMPFVAPADVQAVSDALRSGAAIAVPVAGQRRGHPVGFSKSMFDDLKVLKGDSGARSVLARHEDGIVEVPVSDARTWQDVDTSGDLVTARQWFNTA